jgi:clan AA aspartic protease
MNGFVDEQLRALIEIPVAALPKIPKQMMQVWIDTAFNGGLVIPREQIQMLGLKKASITEAVLADGQIVELETYSCYLDWFGREYRTQVVANDGIMPLLGTMLLEKRILQIDYDAKKVVLK